MVRDDISLYSTVSHNIPPLSFDVFGKSCQIKLLWILQAEEL